MAGTPGAVRELLMQVWAPAREAAEADAARLEEMLLADGEPGRWSPGTGAITRRSGGRRSMTSMKPLSSRTCSSTG